MQKKTFKFKTTLVRVLTLIRINQNLNYTHRVNDIFIPITRRTSIDVVRNQQTYQLPSSPISEITRAIPQTLIRVLLQFQEIMLLDCRQSRRVCSSRLLLPHCGFILHKILRGQGETPILQLCSVVLQFEQVSMLLRASAVVKPETHTES